MTPAPSSPSDCLTPARYRDLLARAADLGRALAETEALAALRPRAPAMRDRIERARICAARAISMSDFVAARGLPIGLASRCVRLAALRVESLRARLDRLDVGGLDTTAWPSWLPLAVERLPHRR